MDGTHQDHDPASPSPLNGGGDGLAAELQSLHESFGNLREESAALGERLAALQRQNDEIASRDSSLRAGIDELGKERDSLAERLNGVEGLVDEREEEYLRVLEDGFRESLGLKIEVEVYREKLKSFEEERERRSGVFIRSLDAIRIVKEGLVRVVDGVGVEGEGIQDEKIEPGSGSGPEELWEAAMELRKLVELAESRVHVYTEVKNKERKELENSVVSLTEENRDISNLLRVALVEKEAVEKSLNKLKGNTDQRRVPLLHFAERGLQRVGFGFMMGAGAGNTEQQPVDSSTMSSAASTGSKSDGSEGEEEVVSLASTVERIMKNLRNEISQLRRSLEESRSDNERLQSLTNKQAREIAENTLYIKELEERERLLSENVEDLLSEIKETEAEVGRWREACELEVEAGNNEIGERDKVVTILQQELDKTRVALDISNGKVKLKDDLVSAAMAAQEAAERSLELADSRTSELRQRIEDLTRQLEEVDGKDRNKRKRIRRICWPWRVLKMNATGDHPNGRFPNVRRWLPEMQALLHYHDQ
ncbi:hypothetical protein MLD38_002882 [Melastoma candidum]|uniref:Uncharacterized protein n=1 Tax=Melastoma candidum TaxID=119954 RepID=A0ACB9S2R7_9MYRT|nr:hypothetical protein MLD38_002882 [Melastoma candidum]